MLCVRTTLQASTIEGLGLFADQDIAMGTVVWKFQPELDILLTHDTIQTFSESAKEQFYNYAFLDKFHNKYMLCGDDARFFNHSDTPNCDDEYADITIANKNIVKGEELTVNYKLFYADIENHPEIE